MRFDSSSRLITGITGALFLTAAPTWADEASPESDTRVNDYVSETPRAPAHVKALPCRPTIACTAEIVPAGAWEVETGYAARRTSNTMVQGAQLLLKYSVIDHLQVQLATNNVFSAPSSGGSSSYFDGGFVGPKVQFNGQGTYLPMFALSAFLGFPTRSDLTAQQQTYDAYLWGYISKDISRVHTDLNLGLNVLDMRGAPKPQGVVAWSTSMDIAYGLGVMTEGYGFFGGGSTVADAGWLNAISYSPIPEIMFDIGGDVGLAQSVRAYTLFVGVTFVPYRFAPGSPAAAIFASSPPAVLPPSAHPHTALPPLSPSQVSMAQQSF